MARTIRRKAHGHMMNARNEVWNRSALAIGLKPFDEPDWRIFSDAFGADSQKPFKRAGVDEHRSSVRRFVKDALTRGDEPIVLNENARWYSGVGVVGVTIKEAS